MYKGGFIVPILMALLVIVITFVIERFATVNKSKGKGNIDTFVHKMRAALTKGDIDGARKECERQKGSIAAVVSAGLNTYKQMENEKV
jgi:biopolymer transport protein ExbB